MSYDLTAVLTTIAAASASIVAILGGFIASKLIAISSERSAVLDHLKQINKELEFHVSERDKIQAENDEDDALDFIRDAIDDLYADNSLENVYLNVDHPGISMESLKPYWDRAVTLKEQFREKVEKHDALNEDYIPESLLFTVKEDDFGYEVLLAMGKKLRKRSRTTERVRGQANNLLGFIVSDINDLEISTVTGSGYTYHKNCDSIQEHNSAIALLELQKKQCDEQILALKRPRGMKLGLLIFALFTFCCIIAPLVASPFATESYNDFVIAKAIFLGLFGIGLISVFGYLIYLLQWHQDR